MASLRSLALVALLGFALAPLARAQEMKEIEVPADLKSREVVMILWAGDHEGDFGVAPASTTSVETIQWNIEGPAIIETLKQKCTGFKHIYARVKAVLAATKIMVPVSGRPKDYRVIDYTVTLKEVLWTKNPDEWFIATQQTETQAIKACNLIIARDLAKALAALEEAQKLAEEIEYGTSPFQRYHEGPIAWAAMVESLQSALKDEQTFRAEPGGFDEIQALLRFYYEWAQTFQQVHLQRLGFQSMDVIDGLMRTAKYYASVAKQRLVKKLAAGALQVGKTETERAAKEWPLSHISILAYNLYEAKKYLSAYEMIRDTMMLKEGSDLRPKEDMLEDLVKWVGSDDEFLAALPEDQVRRFPGQVEHMIHKLGDSPNIENLRNDAELYLGKLKEKRPNLAWDPSIDTVIENIQKASAASSGSGQGGGMEHPTGGGGEHPTGGGK